jgi:O-antigen/teichoic acid export membrane protein
MAPMVRRIRNLEPEETYLVLRAVYIIFMTLFQIGIPILFISEFGLDGYGEWIIAISVSTFISLCDFGMFNSVANEAIRLRSTGKDFEAEKTLECLWKYTFMTALTLITLVLILDKTLLTSISSGKILSYIAIGIVLQTIIRLNEAISRAHVNPRGFGVLVLSYIIETVVLTIFITLQKSMETLALSTLISRLFFIFVGSILNRQWLSPRKAYQRSIMEIIEFFLLNLRKGLGFLAMPVGSVLLFDASNLILAALMSKEFVATLSLLRISTGIIRQFSSAILTSYSPSLSREIFSGNKLKLLSLKSQVRNRLILSTAILFSILALASDLIITEYFKNAPLVTLLIFIAFLISVAIDVPWNYRAAFLFAANEHEGVAKRFLLSSLIGAASLFYLAPKFGLFGVMIAFCIQDILLTRYTFIRSDALIQTL